MMKTPLRYCRPSTLLVLLILPCMGAGQTGPTGAGAPVAGAVPVPEYHPSFGDLMTMAVQPRHIKLWLAGKQGNWAYAAYELSELRNAFLRIARTIPTYQSADSGELMTAMVKAPLDLLNEAVASGDPAKFNAAYAQLTNACNACHQSLKHRAVVIKVPDASMFPDQDFRRP